VNFCGPQGEKGPGRLMKGWMQVAACQDPSGRLSSTLQWLYGQSGQEEVQVPSAPKEDSKLVQSPAPAHLTQELSPPLRPPAAQ
jgi:hypothetical protein